MKVKDKGNEAESVIEVDTTQEEVLSEVEIQVRVVIGEDKKFTLTTQKLANDKVKVIAEELAEMLNFSKYALTFFYKGEKVSMNERLGDKEIGCRPYA